MEVLGVHLSREAERAESGYARIHVIAGTAGVGKTALALHWAHRVREHFPDGQLYVDLRGYGPGLPADPDQVLERFLRALGVPSDAIPADTDSRTTLYRSLLADRRALVMLDNAATVSQVRPLLPGSSDCTVLVTSRSRLSGLIARDGAQRLTVGTLRIDEAVALLELVTGHYRGGDTEADVAELAHLCGHLPLALRIAAERAASRPHMPLTELISDLRDESGLWEALASDDKEEADAVRSVFAWSYRALPRDSARLFRLLALHPGPDFDVRAAAVLNDSPLRQVRQPLDSLVGAHLLEQTGPDRYKFHDLLRSYALEQVRTEESAQERRRALDRLATWYLYAAHAAVSVMDTHLPLLELPRPTDDRAPSFSTNGEAVRWYEQERANLLAITRAAAEAELHTPAWQLPVVLRHVHTFRAPAQEWTSTARIGLESARHEGEKTAEADLLESLGMACVQAQRPEEALLHHTRAWELRHEVGDTLAKAVSLNSIGLTHLRARRLSEAAEHFERALTQVRELRERVWEGIVLGNLAATVLELGRPEQAIEFADLALELHRRSGNQMSAFACLTTRGRAWQLLEEPQENLRSVWEALGIARELANPVREAYALLELGRVQTRLGDLEEALESFHRAASLHRGIADHVREAESFEGVGEVYRILDRPEEAAKFYRQAVEEYRGHQAWWRLAVCLDRSASVMVEAGDMAAACRQWREVLAALEDFTDAQAERLREQVLAHLNDAAGSG